MGLLDEAIREHLELKRRGGADPTAVELAEQEALAPVFPEDDAALDTGHVDGDYAAPPHGHAVESAPPPAAPVQDLQDADQKFAEFSTMGQDTAELDMTAVLAEGSEVLPIVSPLDPVRAGAQAAFMADDSEEAALEWDAAGETDDEPPQEGIPGQERLSFE